MPCNPVDRAKQISRIIPLLLTGIHLLSMLLNFDYLHHYSLLISTMIFLCVYRFTVRDLRQRPIIDISATVHSPVSTTTFYRHPSKFSKPVYERSMSFRSINLLLTVVSSASLELQSGCQNVVTNFTTNNISLIILSPP